MSNEFFPSVETMVQAIKEHESTEGPFWIHLKALLSGLGDEKPDLIDVIEAMTNDLEGSV